MNDANGSGGCGGCLMDTKVTHEIVMDVMANHVVKPIPDDRLAAMQEVVDKADAAFRKRKGM